VFLRRGLLRCRKVDERTVGEVRGQGVTGLGADPPQPPLPFSPRRPPWLACSRLATCTVTWCEPIVVTSAYVNHEYFISAPRRIRAVRPPALTLDSRPLLQQRQAHESPVIFYSCLIGAAGPLIMVTVPPIRKSLGYQPTPHIPTSYPREYAVLRYFLPLYPRPDFVVARANVSAF
jgi:hypothetical protein